MTTLGNFSAGEVLTSADMNLIGTYTAYTPTFTNVTVGNGVIVSRYCQINDFVHYWGRLTFGSTSAIVSSTTNISVPATINSSFASPNGLSAGQMSFYDASTFVWYKGEAMTIATNTVLRMRLWNVSGTTLISNAISSTVPFTWTTGDIMSWNLFYEAA